MSNITINTVKAIAAHHGIKGFRKLKLKNPTWLIGRQTKFVPSDVSHAFLDDLIKAGCNVAQLQLMRELADKGFLDSVTVTGLVADTDTIDTETAQELETDLELNLDLDDDQDIALDDAVDIDPVCAQCMGYGVVYTLPGTVDGQRVSQEMIRCPLCPGPRLESQRNDVTIDAGMLETLTYNSDELGRLSQFVSENYSLGMAGANTVDVVIDFLQKQMTKGD